MLYDLAKALWRFADKTRENQMGAQYMLMFGMLVLLGFTALIEYGINQLNQNLTDYSKEQ